MWGDALGRCQQKQQDDLRDHYNRLYFRIKRTKMTRRSLGQPADM
jgi:hypothetical protein